MKSLDALYARLLHVGFIVIRQALDAGDQRWLDAELEFLHNVPSLIGENNPNRHQYFWEQERAHYLEWIAVNGSTLAKSRMRTYYEPVLSEISLQFTFANPLTHNSPNSTQPSHQSPAAP